MENEICARKPHRVIFPKAMSRDLNVEQIKKLWVLDLIIRHGSLRKAALEAKVSPSAISQSLAALEASVGKPLILRERGACAPTAEALSILSVVRPAFEAFDRLKDLQQTPPPQMTWLNFGTYESLSIDVLPGLVGSLREKMPHLRLGVRISRTAQLLSMVRKGELCSALITEVDDLDRFYVKDVAEDRLGFYISKKHPIAERGWRAVEDFGIGTLNPGKEGLPRYYTRFLKASGVGKPFLVSDSFETLRAAAAAGTVVAVLPDRVARRGGDLLEITPPRARASDRDQGRHRIMVVSQLSCDPEETDFLAREASRFLLPRDLEN